MIWLLSRPALVQTRLLLAARHLQLVRDEIETYPNWRPIVECKGHLFFEKIFNELLGIHVGLPFFFEASTAVAKRSRLWRFLS